MINAPARETARKIAGTEHIAIVAHVSPDADTLGSSIALSLALDTLGIKNEIYCDGVLPRELGFIPSLARVREPEENGSIAPMAIAVDVSDHGRLGRCANIFDSAEDTVVIDHHHTNTGFGRHNLLWSCAATGEIMLEVIREMGVSLTPDIATCLFAAISTDTGNFNYSNVTGETMRAAATLIDAGVDVSEITERLFRRRSLAKTLLIGRILSGIRIRLNGRISVMTVTKNDLAAVGADESDCEGLVNYGIELEGVEVAIFARETAQGIKLSLRSRGEIDVGEFARNYAIVLGGGGHAAAAGMIVPGEISSVVESVAETVEQVLTR